MSKKNLVSIVCLSFLWLIGVANAGNKSTAIELEAKQTQQVANGVAVEPKNDKQTSKIFRMGSGSVGGNYFVLGALVGDVVSHPIGSLPCGKGGTCGVVGLNAENITTAGSMDSLTQLLAGQIETGFIQSDIAYWAYTGTGLFANKDKNANLRAIASLYPEAMHIVVRKAAGIESVIDLQGKRVSVGSRKSGTIHGARLVLGAYKLTEDDMDTQYLNNQQAIAAFNAGELDAMFFSVGAPAPSLEQLFTESQNFRLLSIAEAERQTIFKQGHYFSPYTIAAGTYANSEAVDTISVYALWLTTDQVEEQLVYDLTKALWDESAKQLFNSSHVGRHIDVENSLKGIGIPLHDGAKKYYNEIGKRF